MRSARVVAAMVDELFVHCPCGVTEVGGEWEVLRGGCRAVIPREELARHLDTCEFAANHVDQDGCTRLFRMAAAGKVHDITRLLANGTVVVDCPNAEGCTPLMVSARHAHSEVLTHLLACGANVNHVGNGALTALLLVSVRERAYIPPSCHSCWHAAPT